MKKCKLYEDKICNRDDLFCCLIARYVKIIFLPCNTLSTKFELYDNKINKVRYYDEENIIELIDYVLDKDIPLEHTLQLIKIKNKYTTM